MWHPRKSSDYNPDIMRLTFLGAARTVTGSCHLLEAAGKRILLDCGLRQGKRKQSFEANRKFDFAPDSIEAVVLSHAHIDHSGNLPRLCAFAVVLSSVALPIYLAYAAGRTDGAVALSAAQYAFAPPQMAGQVPGSTAPVYARTHRAETETPLPHIRAQPWVILQRCSGRARLR